MVENRYAEKIKDVLGENLVTLAEYNNGDEVRCLAICNSLDFKTLTDLKVLDPIPIIFTKDEIKNALDVFPVEFLNIKRHHDIIHGEDILKDITVSRKNLRHQLEFEFRSKLIHLRQSYMQSNGDDLEDVILRSVPTIAPIIGALMYLKDEDIKYDPDIVESIVGVDTKVIIDIHNIRIGKTKFEEDKNKYVERLISVLKQIGDIVDKIDVE